MYAHIYSSSSKQNILQTVKIFYKIALIVPAFYSLANYYFLSWGKYEKGKNKTNILLFIL